MPSVFTRIIEGELPGRFVWRDERCVALLTINPLAPGHVMVVPIEEVDHWIDLPPELAAHMWDVTQKIGQALQQTFQPLKVGVMVVGQEVPHTHVHLVPFHDVAELDFANADPEPDPSRLDREADLIRAALRAAGHPEVSA